MGNWTGDNERVTDFCSVGFLESIVLSVVHGIRNLLLLIQKHGGIAKMFQVGRRDRVTHSGCGKSKRWDEGYDNRARAGMLAALRFMTRAVSGEAEVLETLSADIE